MEISAPLTSGYRVQSLSTLSLGHKSVASISIRFKFSQRPSLGFALLICKCETKASIKWEWCTEAAGSKQTQFCNTVPPQMPSYQGLRVFRQSNMKVRCSPLKMDNPDVHKTNVDGEEDRESNEGTTWTSTSQNGFLDESCYRPAPLYQLEGDQSSGRESTHKQISTAKKGHAPWNKGRHHSKETRELIRTRVIEAMKDPKIREKLRIQAQRMQSSPDLQLKIRAGQKRAWDLKAKLRSRQELCLAEWKETIAEKARVGNGNETVYQWNSYATIKKQLQAADRRKLPKKERIPRGSMSEQQKLKIAAAIKAKWADPNYRANVLKGNLVKKGPKHSTKGISDDGQILDALTDTTEEKFSKSCLEEKESKPESGAPKFRENVIKKTAEGAGKKGKKNGKHAVALSEKPPNTIERAKSLPAFKDPESQRKLERLKSMRAHRQKRRESAERARSLISKAEKAAKALEAAAMKDKNALAPLLETRRLLSEATRSIESTSLHG